MGLTAFFNSSLWLLMLFSCLCAYMSWEYMREFPAGVYRSICRHWICISAGLAVLSGALLLWPPLEDRPFILLSTLILNAALADSMTRQARNKKPVAMGLAALVAISIFLGVTT